MVVQQQVLEVLELGLKHNLAETDIGNPLKSRIV